MSRTISVIAFLAVPLSDPSGLLGQARWEVSATPIASIGMDEGPPAFLFHRVKGAVRLDESTIVVGDGGSSEIRVFSMDGEWMTSFGRKGGGPKEFGAIGWIDRCGRRPEIVVFDEMRKRISKWDRKGNLLVGFQIEGPDGEGGLPPYSVDCGPGGDYVVVGWPDVRGYAGEMGPYRLAVKIGIVDERGRMKTVIGSFPGPERYRYTSSDGPRPLGKTTRALRGEEEVYVATADAPSILVIGRDGERRTIGREDFQSIALNGEILQAYKDSVIDSSPAGRRPGVRRSLGNHQFPEFLPPYRDVRLDRQGLIWIAHFGIPGRQINEWDVFNPSGEWVASVEMPDQFHPTEIGADYLLGVRFDSMDVERVQVFSLQR